MNHSLMLMIAVNDTSRRWAKNHALVDTPKLMVSLMTSMVKLYMILNQTVNIYYIIIVTDELRKL
jgi:hypothetical protein